MEGEYDQIMYMCVYQNIIMKPIIMQLCITNMCK